MVEVVLPPIGTAAAWRTEARRLAGAGVPAASVLWRVGEAAPDLFAGDSVQGAPVRLTLPREAIDTLATALHHKDPQRFARAYDLVLRLSQGHLRWGDRGDPVMRTLLLQDKSVRREVHKIHAFVRFREQPSETNRRRFAAWIEPEHPCLEVAAPFFAKRFGDMDWVISTPQLVARFVEGDLQFLPATTGHRPPPDEAEDLWRVYYANIFNPARLMTRAMQSEMPRKYWKNLPEADLIEGLVRQAPDRVRAMHAAQPSQVSPRKVAAARRMVEKHRKD